ncbi:MAG: xylulokinase, partial [Lysinibacillus sp.]
DEQHKVLRPAILWNDTRTTEQCETINAVIGKEQLIAITKNKALEGFTLPKLLWVQQYEPHLFRRAKTLLLPKDYVRFAMTGALHMEYSDAAGTLLLDLERGEWSEELARKLAIDPAILPPLVQPIDEVGTITEQFAERTGLSTSTRVFAGGADNACGAVGAGIVSTGKTMVSIGTSGVLLSFETNSTENFDGQVHYFNHAVPNSYYRMGVTLSAGHSLSWFRDVFMKDQSFEEMLAQVTSIPPGSNGLMYTPYIVGERTPYADAHIRGSFIGMDASHTTAHFTRAVMEGIVFSLRDSLEIIRQSGKDIQEIISIGGGAKNDSWLQMQADIFNATVYKLKSEQGPSLGACIIAAVGAGLFENFDQAVAQCVQLGDKFEPIEQHVKMYEELYDVYRQVYGQTKTMNDALYKFRA